jgi:hypothetical protein
VKATQTYGTRNVVPLQNGCTLAAFPYDSPCEGDCINKTSYAPLSSLCFNGKQSFVSRQTDAQKHISCTAQGFGLRTKTRRHDFQYYNNDMNLIFLILCLPSFGYPSISQKQIPDPTYSSSKPCCNPIWIRVSCYPGSFEQPS